MNGYIVEFFEIFRLYGVVCCYSLIDGVAGRLLVAFTKGSARANGSTST